MTSEYRRTGGTPVPPKFRKQWEPEASESTFQMTYEHFLREAYQHHQAGQVAAAERVYRAALELRPNGVEAQQLLAILLNMNSRPAEALPLFEASVNFPGNEAIALSNLGDCLRKNRLLDRSATVLEDCVKRYPDFIEAHVNLGNTYLDLYRFDDAEREYALAAACAPKMVLAHNGLGAVEYARGNFDRAVPHLERALQIDPNYAAATHRLLSTLTALGQYDQSRRLTHEAIARHHKNADVLQTLALNLIWLGDWEDAWPLHEKRLEMPDAQRSNSTVPRWKGETAPTATLLLESEQGLGDSIQFARYATLAAQRVGKVIVRCPPPLMDLLRNIEGVAEVISSEDPPPLPPHTLRSGLMSLPMIFKTTPTNVPLASGYLRPSAQALEKWKSILGSKNENVRVGLVWAGNTANNLDSWRSVGLPELAGLGRPNVQFYSLQVGRNDGLAESSLNLIDLAPQIKNFDDTAAAIDLLDLVITVDTSVAHVAGGLGKPTWVLLPVVCGDRWLTERADTPWYASARLYRQTRPRHWESVIQKVAADLDDFVRKMHPPAKA